MSVSDLDPGTEVIPPYDEIGKEYRVRLTEFAPLPFSQISCSPITSMSQWSKSLEATPCPDDRHGQEMCVLLQIRLLDCYGY